MVLVWRYNVISNAVYDSFFNWVVFCSYRMRLFLLLASLLAPALAVPQPAVQEIGKQPSSIQLHSSIAGTSDDNTVTKVLAQFTKRTDRETMLSPKGTRKTRIIAITVRTQIVTRTQTKIQAASQAPVQTQRLPTTDFVTRRTVVQTQWLPTTDFVTRLTITYTDVKSAPTVIVPSQGPKVTSTEIQNKKSERTEYVPQVLSTVMNYVR